MNRFLRILPVSAILTCLFSGLAFSQFLDEPPPPEPRDYSGPSNSITPAEVPPELQAKLDQYRPDSNQIREQFEEQLQRMIDKSDWLKRSMRDPISTPLTNEDGTNIGPTVLEVNSKVKRMIDLMRDDYLANSKDTEERKQAVNKVYESVIMDQLCENDPEPKDQKVVLEMFNNGNIDPFILYLNMGYNALGANDKKRVMDSLVASLKSRRCAAITDILLTAQCNLYINRLTGAERDVVTRRFLKSLPRFIRQVSSDDDIMGYTILMIVRGMRSFSSQGIVDVVKLVVDLHEGENGEQVVPEIMLQSCLEKVEDEITRNARGTTYLGRVSDENLAIFRSYAKLSIERAMKIYLLDPESTYGSGMLHIRNFNNVGGATVGLSAMQTNRLAMRAECDSRRIAEGMARATQNRWGGSMEQMEAYWVNLIRLAQAGPSNRFLFRLPYPYFTQDRGARVNFARETPIAEPIAELWSHLQTLNGDKPDPRMDENTAAMMTRMLWDAGLVEEHNTLIDTYSPIFGPDIFYRYSHHRYFAEKLKRVFQTENAPRNELTVLQNELLCGGRYYNEARFEKIDRALAALKAFAENLSTDADDSAASLVKDFETLREIIGDFHDGKEVELLANAPRHWTTATLQDTVTYNKDSIEIDLMASQKSVLFFHVLRFENPCSIEMDVIAGQFDGDPYGIALFAGQVAPNSNIGDQYGRSLRFAPGAGIVTQDRLPAERLFGPFLGMGRLDPGVTKATLRIDSLAGGVKSYFNGDAYSSSDDSALRTEGHVQFGRLCGRTFRLKTDKKAEYKITSIRIKKLAKDAE